MGATRTDRRRGRTLVVALAIASATLVAGGTIFIGRNPGPAPDPAACLVSSSAGLKPLDYVDNLETCGARLEALYLRDGRPVTGAFGGLRVFADARGIDAASGRGPRERLVAPATRRVIDADLIRLMRAKGERPVIWFDAGATG